MVLYPEKRPLYPSHEMQAENCDVYAQVLECLEIEGADPSPRNTSSSFLHRQSEPQAGCEWMFRGCAVHCRWREMRCKSESCNKEDVHTGLSGVLEGRMSAGMIGRCSAGIGDEGC